MVQVLESNPSFAQQMGRALGEQGGKFASQFAEDLALKKRGIDVSGLTGYARDVAIKEGTKRAMLLQQGQRTLAPHGGQAGTQETMGAQPTAGTQPQQGALPSSRQTPSASQTQQTGTSKSIIPPERIESEAIRRGQAKISRGEPTDLQTEIGLIQQENANVAQYQAYQQQAGAKAEEMLTQAFPDATPEQRSLFQRKAEQYATQGLSQAEINRNLSLDTKKFANQMNSLRDIQGARAYHKAGQFLTGSGREPEKVRESIRQKAKPFLDQGLYDTVRSELSNKGYGPEEIESTISELGEQTKKNIAEFGKVKAPLDLKLFRSSDVEDPSYRAYRNNPEGQKVFGDNLKKTLSGDPSTNLILLRKAYEDKGVDWDTFKTEFSNMINSGEFQPNDDQLKQMDYLEEPPLNRLQKIFYDLNLRGR